jgi:hypothetical protein
MKGLALIPLTVLLAACGSSSNVSRAPLEPAPRSVKTGPPPAWVETKAGNHWLGLSSWCWRSGNTGVCADAVAPKCGRQGTPDVAVDEGELIRAHLGYDADEASVDGAHTELKARVVSWRVDSGGTFLLFTKGKEGDASYVACARFG